MGHICEQENPDDHVYEAVVVARKYEEQEDGKNIGQEPEPAGSPSVFRQPLEHSPQSHSPNPYNPQLSQFVQHSPQHSPQKLKDNLYEHLHLSSKITNPKLVELLQAQPPAKETYEMHPVSGGFFEGHVNASNQPEGDGYFLNEKGLLAGNFKKGVPQGKTVAYVTHGDSAASKTVCEYSGGDVKHVAVQEGTYKFQGDCSGRLRNGRGTQTFLPSGQMFAGIFSNDSRKEGDYYFQSNQHYNSYSGEFHDGKWTEKGVFQLRDKTQLRKVKQLDQNTISAEAHYPNGHSYTGQLVRGLRQGQGIYKSKKDEYEGGFERGQRHGEGRLRFQGQEHKVTYDHGRLVSVNS